MKRQSGFTLVELCTLLLLISLASSIMLPNLHELLIRNRALQQKDLLISHLNFARSHAILQTTRVEMCGSSNGVDCDQQWQLGWLVRTQQGQLLRQQRHSATEQQLTWRGFSSHLTFLPNGTSHASNGMFQLCDTQGNLHWKIILNRQGRAREEPVSSNPNTSC